MVKVVVLLTYVFFSASGGLRAEAYPNDPLTFCLVDDINNGHLSSRGARCISRGQQWQVHSQSLLKLRMAGIKKAQERKYFVSRMEANGYKKITEIGRFDLLIKGGTLKEDVEVCILRDRIRYTGQRLLTCTKNSNITTSYSGNETPTEIMERNGFVNVATVRLDKINSHKQKIYIKE